MTVSTTTNRVTYAGDGVTTAFSFPAYFLANADLVVYKITGGIATLQVLNTDYTVTGAGVLSGGTVTMTTAPASGTTLLIYRDVALTQTVDYQSNDAFPAETHETALDRLTMMAQRVREMVSRALRLTDSDASGADTTVPSPSANALLGWNSSGNALQNVDAGTLGALVTYGTAYTNTFTGNGVTTAFLLTANPGSIHNLRVTVDGLAKRPTTDFTWNGSLTITFTVAPANAAVIMVQYVGGLPTSYSGAINVTVGAGTAGLTVGDGTRQMVFTPNTTQSLSFNNGGINFQIGGSNFMSVSTARAVVIPPPTSGIALTVQNQTAAHGLAINGTTSAYSAMLMTDGQTGNKSYTIAVGQQAIGNFTIRDNTGSKYVLTHYQSTNQFAFQGGVATPPVVANFSATAMTVDCGLSNVFTTTFTANVTVAPTLSNPGDGQTINWFITQDATGSRTMTWPTSFKWPGGTAGVLSTAANSVDLLVATYRSSTGFWYASLQKGFA